MSHIYIVAYDDIIGGYIDPRHVIGASEQTFER